ncbi:hypothetical protein H257_07724 [Aphanomyces astaci]|uniref:Amine oxidase domain-containing protein n=1 Tax=Aphanomyces astaci TaxID=112090 RepID=W4GIR8_APHAT|nr:hypothetical protein H257_07724 [Aphanomyces astaci]ETV78934.1 hypothetical protein H257_07724 [Aphanomyces astaci]|eukprot:XP_009831653.1 hypothetical protein H257_07724 [Aphanomyces astaci]
MVDPANVVPKRVVIVGSGVTGLVAARTLSKYSDCHVTLVEAADRVGGHAYTIDGPTGERMDIGFMVMNDLTYPNLIKLFSDVGAAVEPSDMSFSVFDESDSWSFQSSWSWTLDNIFRPRLWQFVIAHKEFAARGLAFLADDTPRTTSTRDFAAGLNQRFVDKWLVPFISAVWSTSADGAMDFPIQPLLKFMHHHMFLTLETVKWTTPAGRSETYVQKVLDMCPHVVVRTSAPAARIDTTTKHLVLESGEEIPYDALILACSAPQAAALAPPPSTRAWLAQFETNSSRIVCHTSSRAGMPTVRADWSAWNVSSTPAAGPQVTYWISRLQTLANQSVYLSLNPSSTPEGTFFETELAHPVMNAAAYQGQLDEVKFQGHGDVYFAGAWLRNGFHEDGAVSGIIAARRAIGREDIPVEFPTLAGLPAVPVVGWSHHCRFAPSKHAYAINYDMHLYRFDTRSPPANFCRVDHFGDASVPLDTCVRRELAARINYWPLGKIEAVANLRYLGLGFNPITPYFCHDEAGTLTALLLEVHNTPWNERCLYAMRVGPHDVLDPAIHPKAMHVSPFNAPPSSAAAGIAVSQSEYEFKLVGKSSITVTLRDQVSKSVIMTASWKVDDTTSHTVQTGSWRTVIQIYIEAVKLVVNGLVMYSYEAQPKVSITSPLLVVPVLVFGAVAAVQYHQGLVLSALLFALLGPLVAVHHRYHGAMLPISILAVLVGLCAFANAATHSTLRVHGGVAAVAALTTSLFATPDHFQYMRLLSYANAGMAVVCDSVLPHWAPLCAAYMSMLFLWTSRHSTSNVCGSVATAVQAASAIHLASEALLNPAAFPLVESLHGLLATHLLYGLLAPSSNWEFYLHICMVLLVGVLHLVWEQPVLFSWPVLTFLIGVQITLSTAYAYLSRSKGFLAARDRVVIRGMRAALSYATNGQVLVTTPHESEQVAPPSAAVLVVNQPFAFFEALLSNGELGLGEAFVRNEWSVGPHTTLVQILSTLAAANLQDNLLLLVLPYMTPSFYLRRAAFLLRFGALDRTQSANSIAEHYDDGDALFRAFLGEDMVYTSASWDGLAPDAPLADAQRHKVQRILELSQAKPGEKLMDIGSGWGYLVHAGRQRGILATGLCNCRSMVAAARARYGDPLFALQDYRDIPATYDHAAVTAVEMIEAVPAAHYADFAAACHRALKPGGRVVMQVIHAYAFNNPVARTRAPTPLGTFVTTHIFPGQQVPNLEFLHEAFLEHKFKRVFTETRSHDYADTLMLWAAKLDAARHTLPPTVYRKYKYYLNWCEVGFRIEKLHLSRVVFEKPVDANYSAPRPPPQPIKLKSL